MPERTASVNRTASAPNSSHISSGSTTFPFVFDIFWPFSSRTRPWSTTSSKGARPSNHVPAMIIRATQKKRMSKPVTRTLVG